jgi:signal peptidase
MTVRTATIAHWAVRGVLLFVLTLVAAALAILIVIPRATHGVAMTVLTGSMTPTIPTGSVVIDRPVDPGTLHVGDIATYQKTPGKAEYITHRIVAIDTHSTPTMFTFKGDANRGRDVPVPATAIRGRVWFHVPYLGAIRDTVHTKTGVLGFAMLGLAGYALVQLGSALRDRKRAAALPESGTTRVRHDSTEPGVVILTTLPTAAFSGLTPKLVASLLRAVLVDEDPKQDTFTLLLRDDPDRVAHTVALFESFDATLIEVSAPESAKASTAPAEIDMAAAEVAHA